MAHNGRTGVASGDAVRLDEFNFTETAKGLPDKARMVLSAAMNLPLGSLKVRMGPDAELVLKNWRLPGRAFNGGTIGIAESYMDGDWDSPDVTSFLDC